MPDREDTTTRIEKLEQEMAALKVRVATLESRSGGSATPPPSTGSPTFQAVMMAGGDGPFGQVQIIGSGFHGGENVHFNIKSVTRFPSGQQTTTSGDSDLTATAEGRLDGAVGVECPAGASTTHTFQAHGSVSGALAGDVSVSC